MPALQLSNGGGCVGTFRGGDRTDIYIVWGMLTTRNEAQAISKGLPARGNTMQGGEIVFHLEFLEAVNSAIENADNWVEIWMVKGTNQATGSLGNRRSSRVRSDYEQITIPNWTKHTPPSGSSYYVAVPMEQRVRSTRITVFVEKWKQTSGITEDAIEQFDWLNAGGWVKRNNKIFQYLGSTLTTSADNKQLVIVKYKSVSGLPAIPVGTYAGYDVAVPALTPLCEYAVHEPASPGQPGSITITNPEVAYFPAQVPPWDQ